MLNELEFSELLCAKFCHDLAGPIGAVNNGVEFLQEDDAQMKERASQLIEISAKQSVARLQFFRHIYGSVQTIGEANLTELRSIIENQLATTKCSIDWSDDNMNNSGVSIGHKLAKLLLNVVYVCSGVLIHGGNIVIRFAKLPNGKRIRVVASGSNIKLDPETIKILSGQLANITITTKNVQFYLTSRLIENAGVNFTIADQSLESVTFTIDQIRT